MRVSAASSTTQGQLGHRIDAVAARHHERRQRGRRQGRRHSIPLEVDVDLAVPAAPRLGGGEHAAAAAHVAKRALPRAVGAAARDAGDTRHRAPRAPRLGRGLHAGGVGDGVGLARVLVEAGVDLGGWGEEEKGERDRTRRPGGAWQRGVWRWLRITAPGAVVRHAPAPALRRDRGGGGRAKGRARGRAPEPTRGGRPHAQPAVVASPSLHPRSRAPPPALNAPRPRLQSTGEVGRQGGQRARGEAHIVFAHAPAARRLAESGP